MLSGNVAVTPIRVLLVDDEDAVRRANAQTLSLADCEVQACADAEAALAACASQPPDVVVSDVRMPGMDGLALFRRLQTLDAELPVILVTGHGDVPMAVRALRDGVYDFLAKPFPAEQLIGAVRRAAERRRLVLDNRTLRRQLERAADDDELLLGDSAVMQRLRRRLRDIAQAQVDVLVLGETGAGKDVVAQCLHRFSPRAARPFVALNCGALPETVAESELFGHEAGAFTGAVKRRIGRIQHADGGTLFLDEIESMPLALQVKLLRVVEQRVVEPLGCNELRPVDLRIVAATKVDLAEAAARREFREDLYHRLNVVTVRIPPLRERREDIPLLFTHFATRAAQRFGRPVPAWTAALRTQLEHEAFPGNVRELAHLAERYVLGLHDDGEAAIPAPPQTLAERVESYERELLRRELAAHGGDVRATIEALGLARKTFYDKLQRHGLKPQDFRG